MAHFWSYWQACEKEERELNKLNKLACQMHELSLARTLPKPESITVTLLRALKARRWRREFDYLGKSTGSYGEPEITRVTSPKVDVQAWPLSNTTVQEELL